MVFNSYIFILIFLPLTLTIYFLINQTGKDYIARIFLLVMSLLFYSYQNIKALPVFLISIIFNYFIVKLLFTDKIGAGLRKLGLIFGIVANLGALLYFKYLLFFELVTNQIFGTHYAVTSFLVPLGVSFYTFGQIAFLVDSYRNMEMRYEFLDYALFVSFFPKITVGPIAFSNEMIPQFRDSLKQKVNYDNIAKGLYAMAFGFVKKCLFADTLCKYVDWGYLNISNLGTTNALIVLLAYTMQIYFDFSGYCDIASGICLMLNFDLPVNFDSPYKALSISDFWKKWHMTLTRFFRQYVYFPLGGNRKGKIRTYINMFLIFFLSGLWHGAAYTFLVWGAIHGVGICLSKACAGFMKYVPKVIRRIGTFAFVSLTWVFFRSPDLNCAFDFFEQLFSGKILPIDINLVAAATPDEAELMQWLIQTFTEFSPYYSGAVVIVLVLVFAVFAGCFMKNTQERIAAFVVSKKTLIITVILLTWSILSMSDVSKFIYVNF